jgi:glycosyltransferase involved in cell wall biosynthesis
MAKKRLALKVFIVIPVYNEDQFLAELVH